MPEEIFYFKESDIPTELPEISQDIFAPIREGLIAGTLVEIVYEDSSDEESERQILPEVLFRSSENWYVAAYCMLRDEPRTFRLDRIRSANNTGVEEESEGIAEDFRANGIPWKRSQETEKSDGENNKPEWRRLELDPGRNTPEYRIPPPDPEWERELAMRRISFDLVEHAGHGDLEQMTVDIAAGADVNFTGGSSTPLMAAAARGHVNALRLLICHGADPEKRPKTSCTVLNEAARFGRMAMIRYLVEELKLPVNQQDHFGWTPLFCAGMFSYVDAIAYLLEHGADVNLSDKNGCTPLMQAVRGDLSGEPARSIVELLMDHGAEVNRKDKQGRTALFHAMSATKWEAGLERLRTAGADFMVCDKKGASALLRAVVRDYEIPRHEPDFPIRKANEDRDTMALVRYLMQQGVDPNFPNRNGIVPAMAATGKMLKLLLESGANPSAADVFGRTVAMYHANFPDDLRLLQQYGVDMLAKDLRGNDVLLLAYPFPSEIIYLIETFGFPLDDRNDDGVSILLRACTFDQPELVEYLIEHGADSAIRDKNGQTPLEILNEKYDLDERRHDYRRIADLLEGSCEKH